VKGNLVAIPNTTTIHQIDEMPGEEIAFSIGDPRWVMRTQADLYSNRELAVTREYSTNAADANKEAGVTRPIEVSLPTVFNPYFKVRDFGTGMSRDVLAEVYTKFGESTKRDSNEFNGMLGYGCKSAVAYTTTFTVVSICGGIKTTAVISRKPDWSIVMKIVAQVKTDEPSGTEVTVPVHNSDEFRQKAMDFYRFWLPGTVKVDGKEPAHHAGKKIIDGLYASPTYGNSYVVMGNVPYRIENPQALFAGSKMRHFHFVAYVDNGDVEFTPSREDLKYTNGTKEALRSIMTNLETSIVKVASKEIADAKTPAEAFTVWHEWRNSIGFGMFDDLTYKGKKLEETFDFNGYKRSLNMYGRGTERVRRYDVMGMPNTIVITEFFIEASAGANRKVKEYIAQMGWSGINAAIFTSSKASDIVSEWIPRDKFVTWSDLKAALPKKARQAVTSSGRPPGSWDYFDGHIINEGKSIPATGTLYYMTVRECKGNKHPADILKALNITGGIVIRVPQNRLDKFKRDYPNIENLRDIARKKVVKDGKTLLSDDAKAYLDLNSDFRRWISKFGDVSVLNDPIFTKAASLVKNEATLLKAYRDNLALAKSLGLVYHVDEYLAKREADPIAVKYPLARTSLYYSGAFNRSHMTIYINAVYAAEMEKKNDD
jgi:hypothetical protein